MQSPKSPTERSPRLSVLRWPALRWLGVVFISILVSGSLAQRGLLPTIGEIPAGWVATGIAAIIAFILASALRLGIVWRLAAAAAPAAAALFILQNPPAWLVAVIFLLAVGVFWNVRSERVPLYLTNRQTANAISDLVRQTPEGPKGPVVDLGSGTGGTVRALAKDLPETPVVGVENAPLLFIWSWVLTAIFGPANASIRYGSLWSEDLGQYRIVYCFLSSEPMPRLIDKAKNEIKPGGLLVSNTFTDLGNTAEEVVLVGDSRETHLNVWRF